MLRPVRTMSDLAIEPSVADTLHVLDL